jgi:hypothetical protein
MGAAAGLDGTIRDHMAAPEDHPGSLGYSMEHQSSCHRGGICWQTPPRAPCCMRKQPQQGDDRWNMCSTLYNARCATDGWRASTQGGSGPISSGRSSTGSRPGFRRRRRTGCAIRWARRSPFDKQLRRIEVKPGPDRSVRNHVMCDGIGACHRIGVDGGHRGEARVIGVAVRLSICSPELHDRDRRYRAAPSATDSRG